MSGANSHRMANSAGCIGFTDCLRPLLVARIVPGTTSPFLNVVCENDRSPRRSAHTGDSLRPV